MVISTYSLSPTTTAAFKRRSCRHGHPFRAAPPHQHRYIRATPMTLADLETTWLARRHRPRGWEHSNKWEGADSVKRCLTSLGSLDTGAFTNSPAKLAAFAPSGASSHPRQYHPWRLRAQATSGNGRFNQKVRIRATRLIICQVMETFSMNRSRPKGLSPTPISIQRPAPRTTPSLSGLFGNGPPIRVGHFLDDDGTCCQFTAGRVPLPAAPGPTTPELAELGR